MITPISKDTCSIVKKLAGATAILLFGFSIIGQVQRFSPATMTMFWGSTFVASLITAISHHTEELIIAREKEQAFREKTTTISSSSREADAQKAGG